jgi:hypothetical protein
MSDNDEDDPPRRRAKRKPEEDEEEKHPRKPRIPAAIHEVALSKAVPMERAQKIRRQRLGMTDVLFASTHFQRRSTGKALMGIVEPIRAHFYRNNAGVLPKPKPKVDKELHKRERLFLRNTGHTLASVRPLEDIQDERWRQLIEQHSVTGAEQGILVDRQCTAIINHEPIPLTEQQLPYTEATVQQWSGDKLIAKDAVAQIHPFTLMCLSACLDRGWLPVIAQFPVCHRGFATAVDQIWYDVRAKEFVLVELKCEQHLDHPDPRAMEAPFHKLANTARHRHYIQLALTRDMFLRTCLHIEHVQAFLVKVHHDCVDADMSELPKVFVEAMPAAWEVLIPSS